MASSPTHLVVLVLTLLVSTQVQEWPVGRLGLLYDRVWMVVNGHGVCLSQKREPRLCLICPGVHLASNRLFLRASGPRAFA